MSKFYWVTLKFLDGSSQPNFISSSNIEEKVAELKSVYDWKGCKKKVVSVNVEIYTK